MPKTMFGDEVVAPASGRTMFGDEVVPIPAPDQSDAETARLKRSVDVIEQQRQADLVRQYRSSQVNANKVIGQPPGGIEEFIGGAKHAWDRAALGVKTLLPQSVQDAGDAVDRYFGMGGVNPALVEQGAAFVKNTGPASTVGQIAGDVAMSVGPTGIANAGAHLLPLAVARYAVPAADVAANALYAGATAPDDRLTAGALGAVGATGGRVLTRALGGAVQPGPNAQRLLNEGVRLTPGQAGGEAGTGVIGSLASQYERGLANIPAIGSRVKSARLQALDDWQRYLNQVTADVNDLIKARTKAGPISRSTAERPLPQLTPQDALKAGFKADDQGLVNAARDALPLLSDTAPTTSDIGQLLNAARSVAVIGAHGAPAAIGLPAALVSLLSTTESGRRFLLGQIPWQQFANANPEIAAQVVRTMRSAATQFQQPQQPVGVQP